MSTNESRATRSRVEAERDPLGMINDEGVITGTVVSAEVIAAAAGYLEETRLGRLGSSTMPIMDPR